LLEYTFDADGSLEFNQTEELSIETDPSYSHPGCGDRSGLTSTSFSTNLTIDSWGTDSDLGQDYVAQTQAWLANYYTFDLDNVDLRVLPLGGTLIFHVKRYDLTFAQIPSLMATKALMRMAIDWNYTTCFL
jgi:hypothetical protein